MEECLQTGGIDELMARGAKGGTTKKEGTVKKLLAGEYGG